MRIQLFIRYQVNRWIGFDDRLLLITVLPVIALVMLVAFLLYRFNNGMLINGLIYFSSLMITVSIFLGNRAILVYSRKRYPDFNCTRKRILFQSTLVIGHTLLTGNMLVALSHKGMQILMVNGIEPSLYLVLIRTSIGSLTYSALIIGVYEAIYVSRQLKISIAEKTAYRQSEIFISVLLHDVKTPLRFIFDVADNIFSDSGKIDDKERNEYGLAVKNAVRELSYFVNNYLAWLKISQDRNIEKDEVNLQELLLGVAKMNEPICSLTNNLLEISVTPGLRMFSNKNLLERVINNLVDFACKNTSNGRIFVLGKEESDHILISCSDNGVGLTEEQLADVKKFYSSEEPDYISSFHMTHLFIRDFAKIINAKVQVTSEAIKGTSIELLFDQAVYKRKKVGTN